MAWVRKHADLIVLLAVVIGLAGLNLIWTAHQVTASQHQWCSTLDLLTARPVPRPADVAANPSRENAWILYSDFVDLRDRLGCAAP